MVARKAKKKAKSYKTLVTELDRLFSRYIIRRDGHCVVCGTNIRLTCGHLFSRRHHNTRWDMDNCHCQCATCNLKHNYDPYPFTEYVRLKIGQMKLDLLHKRYDQVSHFKKNDLLAMISLYTDLLEQRLNQGGFNVSASKAGRCLRTQSMLVGRRNGETHIAPEILTGTARRSPPMTLWNSTRSTPFRM